MANRVHIVLDLATGLEARAKSRSTLVFILLAASAAGAIASILILAAVVYVH